MNEENKRLERRHLLQK